MERDKFLEEKIKQLCQKCKALRDSMDKNISALHSLIDTKLSLKSYRTLFGIGVTALTVCLGGLRYSQLDTAEKLHRAELKVAKLESKVTELHRYITENIEVNND